MKRIELPQDPVQASGRAQGQLKANLDAVTELLSRGQPSADPPEQEPQRQPCPICRVLVDAREVTSGPYQWSRMVNHLVGAHDAWWPDLDQLAQPDAGHQHPLAPLPDLLDQDDDLERYLAPPGAGPGHRSRTDGSQARRRTSDQRPRPPEDMGGQGGSVERRRTGRVGKHASRSAWDRAQRYGVNESSPAARAICQAYQVDPQTAAAIVDAAGQVGAHPFDLANLISFETNGTFSPSVRGPKSTGAVGLIQFTRTTAAGMGTSTEELAAMSVAEQMPWVVRYLNERRRDLPLDTPHKVAMAVFYPKAVAWTADQEFPEHVSARNTHVLPDGTRFPIRTPADYVHLMRLKSRLPFSDDPSLQRPPEEPRAPVGPAPQVSAEEPGLLDQFVAWAQSMIWGTADQQPPATWDLAPGATGVLVAPDGSEWSPGQVPPGTYRFRSRKTGQDSPPTTLEPDRHYRASSVGRLFPLTG